VTITGANLRPTIWPGGTPSSACRRAGASSSAAIDGAVYAKHGTTFPTRLTVIDKLPADDPAVFPAAPGVASNAATLLGWLDDHLPTRLAVDPSLTVPAVAAYVPRSVRGYINRTAKAVPAAVPMASRRAATFLRDPGRPCGRRRPLVRRHL
jgi:hypothetical protein